MVVNPNYQALSSIKAPAIDSYPRADPTCFDTGRPSAKRPSVGARWTCCPYVNNYDDAAQPRARGQQSGGRRLGPSRTAPDGKRRVGGADGGVEPAGQILPVGCDGFGQPGQLRPRPGRPVRRRRRAAASRPNSASVSTALAAAKAGQHRPAARRPGAVRVPVGTRWSQVTLRRRARPARTATHSPTTPRCITFAAGPGQTPGVDPGQLPHGYLPLPAKPGGPVARRRSRLLGSGRSADRDTPLHGRDRGRRTLVA